MLAGVSSFLHNYYIDIQDSSILAISLGWIYCFIGYVPYIVFYR